MNRLVTVKDVQIHRLESRLGIETANRFSAKQSWIELMLFSVQMIK